MSLEDLSTRPEYEIRYTLEGDYPYLETWMFTPGMLLHFPVSTKEEAIMFLKNWIGFSRFKCSLTCLFENKPIAIGTLFLLPYRKVAHQSMLYFIVDPKYHGKGVGTSLIKNLKHLAKTYFRLEAIHLDVYEGSSYLNFLKKCGFYEITRQEKFVKEKEGQYLARILMETRL